MKKWIGIILIAAASLVACNKSMSPERAAEVQQVVDEQQFVFVAESAQPQSGSTIRLSQGYDLRISKNSVVAYAHITGLS